MDKHELVKKLKELARELNRTPTLSEFVASGISKRQVHKHSYNEIVKLAGLEPRISTRHRKPLEIRSRPPKILIIDIETAPLLVRTYGLWNQNISTGFIKTDWYMLSVAAKWHGEKKVYYKDTRDSHENDIDVVNLAVELIEQADIIVGHNVDRFDLKKINTRVLKHNLKPVPKKQTIDTLKIAKKCFAITSNKLDFIAKFLGVDGKRKSKKYSQQEMWDGCCDGVLDCFKENKKYNIQDIKVTEDVFDKLKSWDESLNFQSYFQKVTCVCGCTEFRKDGIRYTKNNAFQRYSCSSCGKLFTSKESLIDKDLRKDFFK